jgi:hypothetical protein
VPGSDEDFLIRKNPNDHDPARHHALGERDSRDRHRRSGARRTAGAALVAGGIRVLEVTLRTAHGLEAIRAMAQVPKARSSASAP